VQRYLTLGDTRKYWFSNCKFFCKTLKEMYCLSISIIFVFYFCKKISGYRMRIKVINKTKQKLTQSLAEATSGPDLGSNPDSDITLSVDNLLDEARGSGG
jgi:hypothetical protein